MPNAIQSKRRSMLLAAGAMALTLTLGGGLLASGSAFAASADAASQVQSQTDSTSQSKGGGHFGHRGGGFQLGAYESKLAAYLNLDEATLRTKLQTQTLAEVAEAQGITRDALKAQLVAWIDEAKAAADSATTSTSNANKPALPDSSSLADKLLDSKGGRGVLGGGMDAKQHRGPGGFRGFGVDRDQLASALNLTADELKEAAQSGKTLAAIAEAQGVSRDTLKAQLVAWIEAARTAASGSAADGSSAACTQKPALDSSTLADKLLDSPLGGAGKEAHAGFGWGMRALDSDAIAGVLGITADELKTSLASGQTLAELATEKGIDVQKVIVALTASMKSRLDQQLSDGKLTQEQYDQRVAGFADKASAIVNGQMSPHGKHGRSGAGSDSGDASNTAEDSSQ